MSASLELQRSLTARAWEDRGGYQLRQLSGVGPQLVKKLASAGLRSFADLLGATPATIHR